MPTALVLAGLLALQAPVPVATPGPFPDAEAVVAPYAETVERILREAIARGQAYDSLVDLCTTAPHRLSGSTGAAAAVEWSRQAMEAAGLENVHLEPVIVPHWERGSTCRVRVVSPPALAGEELTALALGGSIATPPQGVVAKAIEVADFEELLARRDEAEGSIVFFNRALDPELVNSFSAYGGAVNQRVNGAAEAAKAGGVAAVVRSMSTRLDDFPHTGTMRYPPGVPRIPTCALSTLAANKLSGWLADGPVTLRFDQDPRWLEDKPSSNVIGEWRGSERPDEVLVVGGHLDGWDVGQGAHDDGAGCCEALEAVRLLRHLGLRPRRTIRLVHFMNEENGLAGGRTYHADHVEEMGQHVFALESDRGGFAPLGFTTNAKPKAKAYLDAIAALMAGFGCGDMDTGGGGADIGPMALDGVVLAGLKPSPHRYFDLHHSERDTLEQVSHREINLAAGTMAALLYVLADMEPDLPRNAPASSH